MFIIRFALKYMADLFHTFTHGTALYCEQGRINASAGPGAMPKMWAPSRWAHIFAFATLTA